MYSLSSILKPLFISVIATSAIAFDLATHNHQAQAIEFRVGYDGSGNINNATNAVIRGQSFRLDTVGSYGPANSFDGILKSIRFLFNTAAPTAGTTVLIYSSLPTLADLDAGTGASLLFQSDAYSTVVNGNDTTTPAADGFVGSGFSTAVGATRKSVLFQFTSPLASSTTLTANQTYFALFQSGQLIVSDNGSNLYSGGVSYVANPALSAQGSFDRVFVVTAEAVPFEFESTSGVLVLGGVFALHRLRKKS